MKRKKLWLLFALVFVVGSASSLHGQRLYDKDKDDEAQAAKKLASETFNGGVFDKQLRNLKLITQQDFATYFMSAKRKMNLDINSFIQWNDVDVSVRDIKRNVGQSNPFESADLAKIREKLATQKKDAAAKLAELQAKAKPPENPQVPTAFETLGDFGELLGFAEELLQRHQSGSDDAQGQDTLLSGVGQISQTLETLKNLYALYLKKLDEIDEQSRDLTALKIPMQKVALDRLVVEEQHWKTIGAIQARRAADSADVILMLDDYEASSKVLSVDRLPDARIEDTINDLILSADTSQSSLSEQIDALKDETRKAKEASLNVKEAQRKLDLARESAPKNVQTAEAALVEAQAKSNDTKNTLEQTRRTIQSSRDELSEKRKKLAHVLDVLHVAAALSAHGTVPGNLASLRLAQEEHRYSIRKSAVLARAYEVTVATGTQRLALYYKGGIRPETIAQLVHSAVSITIPVAILAK